MPAQHQPNAAMNKRCPCCGWSDSDEQSFQEEAHDQLFPELSITNNIISNKKDAMKLKLFLIGCVALAIAFAVYAQAETPATKGPHVNTVTVLPSTVTKPYSTTTKPFVIQHSATGFSVPANATVSSSRAQSVTSKLRSTASGKRK